MLIIRLFAYIELRNQYCQDDWSPCFSHSQYMQPLTTTTILRDTFASLQKRGVPNPTVERVVTGEHVVFVSYTNPEGETLPGVVHAPGPPYPDIEGRSADEVVNWALEADPTVQERAFAVATLNALSTGHVDWTSGDPMEALGPQVETVGMVGLFRPAFGKFENVDIRVIERFPEEITPPSDLPPGVSVDLYGPEEATTAFDDASVIYITGSTLVYGGLGRYVAAASESATVVVIGSSSSFVPTVLFQAGVDIFAGAKVIDVEAVTDAITVGASVPELHRSGLEKGLVRHKDRSDLRGLERTSRSGSPE